MRFLFFLLSFSYLAANPHLDTVVHGDVTIATDANLLEVQASDKAIIHWKDFSIAAGEKTLFIQPNSAASVLNRVTGAQMSALMGALEANGEVLLINPNGFLMGADSLVQTGTFTATTLDVLNEDFIRGGDLSFEGISEKGIVNLGKIEALSGDVILAAFQVENQGDIHAEGITSLAATQKFLLLPENEQRILIEPAFSDISAEVGVDQSGLIEAVRVELQASDNPYEFAVQHAGKTHAKDLMEENGKILFLAKEGTILVEGELLAKNSDQGGKIHILGEKIAIIENATLDASHERGGGEILVGGDFQGSNPEIYNAEHVFVDKGVNISVRALENGDAGKAIFWADGYTRMYGTVDARGGASSGDGGFVEVSGKKAFDFRGKTDRSASFGKMGELFLDPESDINITGAGPDDGAFVGGVFFPTLATSNLDLATIATELGLGPVTISTANGVGGAPFGGRITVTSFANLAALTNLLTLTASENIVFENMGGSLILSNVVLNAQNVLFNAITSNAILNVGGNLAINISRDLIFASAGGNLATISSEDDSSQITIGGDVLITSSGGSSELSVGMNNFATDFFNIGGDLNMVSAGGTPSIRITSRGGRKMVIQGDWNQSGGFSQFGGTAGTGNTDLEVQARNFNLSDGAAFGPDIISLALDSFTVIADDSINLTTGSFIINSGPTAGAMNIVVDNSFPTAPGIGPGSFNVDATSFIDTMTLPLKIFTASQSQNTIDGMLNGTVFVPGAFNVDTNQEIWDVYFPSALGTGMPFTIFYKDGDIIIQNPVVQQSFVAQTEILNTFFFEEELISVYQQYDVDVEGKNIPFFMRLRNYGTDITRQVGEVLPY